MLLKKSKKPLPAHELARQALKAGYQTTSKNFVDVIWNIVGTLDNVENVHGQGYRLKKS